MNRRLDLPSPELLRRADFFCQVGWFEGAERALDTLRLRGPLPRHAQHLRAYNRWLLGRPARSEQLGDLEGYFRKLSGLQHAPEVAVSALEGGTPEVAKNMLTFIRSAVRKQSGRLVFLHPTSVLELARHAIDRLDARADAIVLVSVALSANTVVVLDDLSRLMHLLIRLNAPTVLWADWSHLFMRHLVFATVRERLLNGEMADLDGARWAADEQRRSRELLIEALEIAPSELYTMLCEGARHSDRPEFVDVLRRDFRQGRQEGPAVVDPLYWSPETLQCRLPWFGYLEEHEQNFLINAEWALMQPPTADHSMGLAQWWRAVEAVLARAVFKPIVEYVGKHRELVDEDLASLDERAKRDERLFLDVLSTPSRAHRMTLYEMMVVLGKCDRTLRDGRSDSRIRMAVAEMLRPYEEQTFALVMTGSELNPPVLTAEGIQEFRNGASHTGPVVRATAASGRTLARLVLDRFFAPGVRSPEWKFRMLSEGPPSEG